MIRLSKRYRNLMTHKVEETSVIFVFEFDRAKTGEYLKQLLIVSNRSVQRVTSTLDQISRRVFSTWKSIIGINEQGPKTSILYQLVPRKITFLKLRFKEFVFNRPCFMYIYIYTYTTSSNKLSQSFTWFLTWKNAIDLILGGGFD